MTDLERLELILRRTRPSFGNSEIGVLLDILIRHLTAANDTAYNETRKQVFPDDKTSG